MNAGRNCSMGNQGFRGVRTTKIRRANKYIARKSNKKYGYALAKLKSQQGLKDKLRK